MRKIAVGLAALGVLAATPASASYRLVPVGMEVQVARSSLSFTPDRDWNRLTNRVGRNAESWTLDGLTLNDVTFYGGIGDNETLFKEVNKTEKPLPRFSRTMLLPDVASLFEESYRIANNTSLFAIDSIEPGPFAGHPGFHFTYSFTIQSDEVRRKGEGYGAIVDGKLYMATFEAPVIHYFDRDVETFRKLVATAHVGTAKAN